MLINKKMEYAPEQLIDVLEPLLTEHGFWRFPHMSYFVRARDEVRDIVGWQVDENSGRYALYFGVWAKEFETIPLKIHSLDEGHDIHTLNLAHDLLLNNSQQLSYKWSESPTTEQTQLLKKRIEQIVLPYFDTFSSVGDVAELIFDDPSFHNSDLEHRLMNNAFSSFFNYELEQAKEKTLVQLKSLQKLTPAFHYSNGYFWRVGENGIFQIIAPQFLAGWRFVRIQVAVWHPWLDGMEIKPETLPVGFSHVAWRTFTHSGEDASEEAPAFLGQSSHPFTKLEDHLEGVRRYGLTWLEQITTLEDVRAAVRPEFQKFYP